MNNLNNIHAVMIHRSWYRKRNIHIKKKKITKLAQAMTRYLTLVEEQETISCFLLFQGIKDPRKMQKNIL